MANIQSNYHNNRAVTPNGSAMPLPENQKSHRLATVKIPGLHPANGKDIHTLYNRCEDPYKKNIA